MNTSDIYSQIIIENIIKKYLEEGIAPSIEQIEEDFNEYIKDQDLNSSNFTFEEWKVERKEIASASKFNKMTDEMKQDISVLYKSLISNGERSSKIFEKWQNKANMLENRIRKLEARIGRMLISETDTSGYFQLVGDKFTNVDLIDLDRSSGLLINLKENIVGINSSGSTTPTRIFLNNLSTKNAKFNLITKSNIIGESLVDNTQYHYAFLDSTLYWKTHITSKIRQPIIAELVVSFPEEIEVNTIKFDLHSSQLNSVTRITPLLSKDGISFSRINSSNTIGEGIDRIYFQFESTTVKFIKFIMEKSSPDFIDNEEFIYEFGAKEISLYQNTFNINSESVLIGKPLSVSIENNLYKFNKILVETCEGVPEGTSLNYFVSVAKDLNGVPNWVIDDGYSTSIEDINNEDQRMWFPISPYDRTETSIPKILDLVTLSPITYSGINLSFDPDDSQISPKSEFVLVTNSGENISISNQTSTENRYVFGNSNQFALNIQLDKDLSISKENIVLWRNVGSKGLEDIPSSKVRGIQKGWEYESPYYSTTVKIEGSQGLTINVGKNPIEIDGSFYTDIVSSDVLSPGIHKIKVHQNYWNHIEPNLNLLEEIKEKDFLYPFNQKLLIEGYSYGPSYPVTSEKIYQGVDRFAGIICSFVSIFDLNHSSSQRNLNVFALDTDMIETVSGLSDMIILNSDISKSDFVNESFVLEFILTDQLFSYIALKAVFKTEESNLTPLLDEYKIKLGL